ncbi:MAG: pilus assembly protein, partial [Salinisphaera sp.]|nr:pilus assembly protein [Salinisphaera sp.]
VSVPSGRRRQQGTALIEFALIFLPLLLLTIGTLLYGLVFVSQQAFAFAAQRGADAIVKVDPESFRSATGFDVAGYCTAGLGLATTQVQNLLPSVGLFTGAAVVVAPDTDGTLNGCNVTVSRPFPLQIPLLPLPDDLRGEGFVPIRVEPAA